LVIAISGRGQVVDADCRELYLSYDEREITDGFVDGNVRQIGSATLATFRGIGANVVPESEFTDNGAKEFSNGWVVRGFRGG
jgi:hypothetical protein